MQFASKEEERYYYEQVASQKEFLTWYKRQDLPNYPKPSVAVDIITLRYNRELKKVEVLLVQRNKNPWRNKWALVGGFLQPYEDLKEAGIRKIKEETNLALKKEQFKLLSPWSSPKRDPRGWVISCPLLVELSPKDETVDLSAEAHKYHYHWYALAELSEVDFASDHGQILSYALETLTTRLQTQGLSAMEQLLSVFTMKDLQVILEQLLNKNIHYSNLKRTFQDQLELAAPPRLKKHVGRTPAYFKVKK